MLYVHSLFTAKSNFDHTVSFSLKKTRSSKLADIRLRKHRNGFVRLSVSLTYFFQLLLVTVNAAIFFRYSYSYTCIIVNLNHTASLQLTSSRHRRHIRPWTFSHRRRLISHVANVSFAAFRFPAAVNKAQILLLLKKPGLNKKQISPAIGRDRTSRPFARLVLHRLRPHLVASPAVSQLVT